MLYAVVQQASSSEKQQWLRSMISAGEPLSAYAGPDWPVGSPLQGSALRMAKGTRAAAHGAHLQAKANLAVEHLGALELRMQLDFACYGLFRSCFEPIGPIGCSCRLHRGPTPTVTAAPRAGCPAREGGLRRSRP
jgi:hypothetical protein